MYSVSRAELRLLVPCHLICITDLKKKKKKKRLRHGTSPLQPQLCGTTSFADVSHEVISMLLTSISPIVKGGVK